MILWKIVHKKYFITFNEFLENVTPHIFFFLSFRGSITFARIILMLDKKD